MKSYGTRYKANSGFSLIELAIVLVVMGVLAAFGAASYGGINEDRDAQMVSAAQATLQAIVTQGATRLDKRPSEFDNSDFEAVKLAAQAVLGQRNSTSAVTLSNNGNSRFNLSITSTDRTATFVIDDNGVVDLTEIGGFSSDRYRLNTTLGRLEKR